MKSAVSVLLIMESVFLSIKFIVSETLLDGIIELICSQNFFASLLWRSRLSFIKSALALLTKDLVLFLASLACNISSGSFDHSDFLCNLILSCIISIIS